MNVVDVKAVLLDRGVRIIAEPGDEIRAICLFCRPPDTDGHLYFDRNTGQFLCHRCGEKGNLRTLGWADHGGNPESEADRRRADERRTIFEAATKFYAGNLSPDIRDYLRERGFTDETIRCFRLGYAAGGLREHLAGQGLDLAAIKATGLVKDDDRDYFYRLITIPYCESGRIVTLRGRKRPDATDDAPKYLSLKGDPTRLFNVDALRKRPELLLLCEGEMDTMIASQYGFAAIGVPGAQGFKAEWAELFTDTSVIAVVFDPDRAGQKGKDKVIIALGPLIRIIALPKDLDVNDYFLAGHSADDLRQLIQNTKPWLEARLAELTKLPTYMQAPGLKAVFQHMARLEDLECQLYESRIKKQFHIPISEVRKKVHTAREEQERLQTPAERPVAAMSDAEREEAEALLRDERIIERFLDDADRIGLVGEENNKVLLLLTFTSRITENPINIIVKGESSSGKSFLVDRVKMFIPPEDVREFTAISPKALFHRKDSLAHKVMIIYERHGSEEADYSIRSMQSEKKLIFSMPVKDPKTNELITKDFEIDGPVGFIETTTRSRVHPENETRCFELFSDESPEQTANILKQQRSRYLGAETEIEQVVTVWRNSQRLLVPLPVHIPYAGLIEFPLEPIRVRRDHQRFLTLVEVVCLLHQKQRERLVIHDKEHLVAVVLPI